MKASPLFSIIIPTYNRENLVLRAINSVSAQNYKNYEIIVVDDASTDGTRQAVSALECENLKMIPLPTNSGVSAARNAGAEHARGKYVVFLDSDDEFLPGLLSAYTEHIQRWPGIELFWCGFRRVFESATGEVTATDDKYVSANSYVEGKENRLFPIKLGSCCALTVEKSAYQRIGGFDKEFRVREDHEFFIRALAANLSYASLDEIYLLKHLHTGENLLGYGMTPQVRSRIIEGQKRLVEKHAGFLGRPENRLMSQRLYAFLIKWCYEAGRAKLAREQAKQFIYAHGWSWDICSRVLKYEIRCLFKPG